MLTRSLASLALLFAVVACGPEPDKTTDATDATGATTGPSDASTSTATGGGTTGGGSIGGSTTGGGTNGGSTTGGDSTGDGTTGDATTEAGNACGCSDGSICVQWFDGICTLYSQQCVPNPDACVPGYPCAPACQPLCNRDHQDACNNSDCPGEIDGAVHCFGH